MSTYIKTNIRPHRVEDMAVAYDKADDEIDELNALHLDLFKDLIHQQYHDIQKRIRILFIDEFEPYGENPKISTVLRDFRNGYIRVHTTGNNSRVWGKFTNLEFRAVHDFIHCLHEIEFTHQSEIEAYHKQMEYSFEYAKKFPHLNWKVYNQILRSEIVYQSAYKEHFGEFHIEQKIILKEL